MRARRATTRTATCPNTRTDSKRAGIAPALSRCCSSRPFEACNWFGGRGLPAATAASNLLAMATLTIDGRSVTADPDRTILEAARAAGIPDIPTLCWYPKLPIVGNCRICLVSVEGQPKLVPACATKVADGMVVHTESHAAVENRKGVLRLLLERYPGDHLINGGRAQPPHEFERDVVCHGVLPPPPGGRGPPPRHRGEPPGHSALRRQ